MKYHARLFLLFLAAPLICSCVDPLFDIYEDQVSQEGTFKTDEEMIDFLMNNIDDFNALVDTKELCDNDKNIKEDGGDTPIYCEEIKRKLGLLDIRYTKFESELANGEIQEREIMFFPIIYYDRGWFMGGSTYEKGYEYDSSVWINKHNLTDSLSKHPSVYKKCNDSSGEIQIGEDEEFVHWRLIVNYFCD